MKLVFAVFQVVALGIGVAVAAQLLRWMANPTGSRGAQLLALYAMMATSGLVYLTVRVGRPRCRRSTLVRSPECPITGRGV